MHDELFISVSKTAQFFCPAREMIDRCLNVIVIVGDFLTINGITFIPIFCMFFVRLIFSTYEKHRVPIKTVRVLSEKPGCTAFL